MFRFGLLCPVVLASSNPTFLHHLVADDDQQLPTGLGPPVSNLQLPGQNFTQYICNGTKPLHSCTHDLSKCIPSTHIQGTCLQTNHGNSTASAVCGPVGSGNIKFTIWEGSHNCSGTPVYSTQIIDVCEEAGGGAEFIKLECQTGNK
jgi:hypothetical protein